MNADPPLPPNITEAMLDAYRNAALYSPLGEGQTECPICGALLDPGEEACGLRSVADVERNEHLGCRRCQDIPLPSHTLPTHPAADAAEQPDGKAGTDGDGAAGDSSGRDDQ
jgi:hypothetical protein